MLWGSDLDGVAMLAKARHADMLADAMRRQQLHQLLPERAYGHNRMAVAARGHSRPAVAGTPAGATCDAALFAA